MNAFLIVKADNCRGDYFFALFLYMVGLDSRDKTDWSNLEPDNQMHQYQVYTFSFPLVKWESYSLSHEFSSLGHFLFTEVSEPSHLSSLGHFLFTVLSEPSQDSLCDEEIITDFLILLYLFLGKCKPVKLHKVVCLC